MGTVKGINSTTGLHTSVQITPKPAPGMGALLLVLSIDGSEIDSRRIDEGDDIRCHAREMAAYGISISHAINEGMLEALQEHEQAIPRAPAGID